MFQLCNELQNIKISEVSGSNNASIDDNEECNILENLVDENLNEGRVGNAGIRSKEELSQQYNFRERSINSRN